MDIELAEALLIGAAGSLLASAFIFISFKVIPFLASKGSQLFGNVFRHGVNSYEKEIEFAKSAIDKKEYSVLLTFFFYRLFQIIFSLSVATIFLVIGGVYTSPAAKILSISVGFTALSFGVIYQGGIISKVYSYIKSKNG